MTGGRVVILGEVGDNFGAGMTGGMAFVYDPDGRFMDRVNPESLQVVRIGTSHWEAELKGLVEAHAEATDSALAARLLNEWDVEIGKFWQVVPTEIVPRLEMPLSDEEGAAADGGTPACRPLRHPACCPAGCLLSAKANSVNPVSCPRFPYRQTPIFRPLKR